MTQRWRRTRPWWLRMVWATPVAVLALGLVAALGRGWLPADWTPIVVFLAVLVANAIGYVEGRFFS